jgi:hypothetical protein
MSQLSLAKVSLPSCYVFAQSKVRILLELLLFAEILLLFALIHAFGGKNRISPST